MFSIYLANTCIDFLKQIMFLFLAVLGLRCCTGFSLVVVSRGYSLIATHGLLIAVVSLAAEHQLYDTWAQ